jgi:hypothetical protein
MVWPLQGSNDGIQNSALKNNGLGHDIKQQNTLMGNYQ